MLETSQWGHHGTQQKADSAGLHDTRTTKRNNINATYNTEDFTMEELTAILNKFKKRKAPGPDKLPLELFKLLDEENKATLLLRRWLCSSAPAVLRTNALLGFIYGCRPCASSYR